jgi:hypothetical protein
MSKKAAGRKKEKQAKSFLGCLRHFMTPEVFKQAHQADHRGKRHGNTRWELHPLLLVLLVTTWCAGDSQPERFEIARGFYVSLAPKRRRPGQSIQGFHNALAHLPLRVLRVFAAGLRRVLLARLGPHLEVDGFLPFGCDGSRLACPRVEELEKRLGDGSNDQAAPQAWITAIVHLTTGLLWSWRIGKGNASERDHLKQLLPTLPPNALMVTDAGYQSVELARALCEAGISFLMRMSSQTTLYTGVVPDGGWIDGMVMQWTTTDQKLDGRGPMFLRLIRLHEPSRKVDVWLLTNVYQPERLSRDTASRFYKLRWENEGFFRSYKRMLGKVKLVSRTVRLVHREIEGSLLAMQLLLAQGTWARAALTAKTVPSSARTLLLEVRRQIDKVRGVKVRGKGSYYERLQKSGRYRRDRSSSKVKRVWPSRVPHKPPLPPDLRTLTPELILKLHKRLGVA